MVAAVAVEIAAVMTVDPFTVGMVVAAVADADEGCAPTNVTGAIVDAVVSATGAVRATP